MIHVQRSELFDLWCSVKKQYPKKSDTCIVKKIIGQNILARFENVDLCIESTNVQSKVNNLHLYCKGKWDRFKGRRVDILRNEDCAKYFSEVEEFSINRKSPRKTPNKSNESTQVASSGSRGRPRNLFCELAKSQKNKRTREIASNFDTDELCASTIRSL